MKLQDWIQVAVVVALSLQALATLAQPILAARMSRIDQNASTPSQRRGERWIRRFFKSPWVQSPWRLPVPFILIFLFFLSKDLHSTAPLTRGAVFSISFNVAGVLWVVFSMLANMIGAALISREEDENSQWKAIRTILEIQGSLAETHLQISNALESKAPSEAVRDILNTLTALKEEIENVKRKSERRRR
jgi:hypothetical protein